MSSASRAWMWVAVVAMLASPVSLGFVVLASRGPDAIRSPMLQSLVLLAALTPLVAITSAILTLIARRRGEVALALALGALCLASLAGLAYGALR